LLTPAIVIPSIASQANVDTHNKTKTNEKPLTMPSFLTTLRNIILLLLLPTLYLPTTTASPAAYGICQAGCAIVTKACYTTGGFTWAETVGEPPAAVQGCTSALKMCEQACWVVAFVRRIEVGCWEVMGGEEDLWTQGTRGIVGEGGKEITCWKQGKKIDLSAA